MLSCRYLTNEEKRFCASHSDLTFVAPVDYTVEQLDKLPLVGCFCNNELLVYYWLYFKNAGSAYISFGTIGKATKKHIALILQTINFLRQSRTIFGEIEDANKETLHLVRFLGGKEIYCIPGVKRHIVVFEPITTKKEVQNG